MAGVPAEPIQRDHSEVGASDACRGGGYRLVKDCDGLIGGYDLEFYPSAGVGFLRVGRSTIWLVIVCFTTVLMGGMGAESVQCTAIPRWFGLKRGRGCWLPDWSVVFASVFVGLIYLLGLIIIRERFFHNFQSLEIIGGYVSIYVGVLSLFVKFSRSQKTSSFKLYVVGKKPRKIWKIEKLREKNVEIMGKKKSDKKDP